MQPGLMPGARSSKESVNYRQHEKCASCDHFYPNNSCDIVEGNISAQNVCDRWEIKNKTEYRDKEFFEKELNKQRS